MEVSLYLMCCETESRKIPNDALFILYFHLFIYLFYSFLINQWIGQIGIYFSFHQSFISFHTIVC